MIIISNRQGYVLKEYKTDLQHIFRYIKKHPALLNGSVFGMSDIKQRLAFVSKTHKPRFVKYGDDGWPIYDDGKDVYKVSDSKSVFDSLSQLLQEAIASMHKHGKTTDAQYARWSVHAKPVMSQEMQDAVAERQFARNLAK